MVFFLKKENKASVVKREGQIATSELKDASIATALNQFKNASSDTVDQKLQRLGTFSSALAKLAKETGIDAKEIALQIGPGLGADDLSILKAIAGDDSILNPTAKPEDQVALMTLNEFSFLHQEIKTCIDATGNDKPCTINGKTVSKTFLESLVNHLQPVFALRHSEKTMLDAKLAEKIQKEAAWVDGITEETANKLLAQTKSKALLIGDAYTKQFATDFASHYASQAPGDAREMAEKTKDWAFTGDTQQTGEYEASINYNWENKSSKVTFLMKTKKDALPSPLYYLPFDASLVAVQQGKTDIDYGTSFNGNNTDQLLLDAKQTKVLTTENKHKRISFESQSLATDTGVKQGKLLELSREKAVFSPSIPFAFEAVLSGTNNAVLFEFDKPDSPLNPLIQWKNAVQELGSPNQFCQNGKGDTQYPLLRQNANGFFYLPVLAESTSFQLICSPQGATIAIKQGLAFSQTGTFTQNATARKESGTNVSLPIRSPDTANPMSIAGLIEAVKKEQVCVKTTSENTEFIWNPKHVQKGGN